MIFGILRQLRRGETLTSLMWNPGGSFKHSNVALSYIGSFKHSGDTLVHISNSCAASIIGCIVF